MPLALNPITIQWRTTSTQMLGNLAFWELMSIKIQLYGVQIPHLILTNSVKMENAAEYGLSKGFRVIIAAMKISNNLNFSWVDEQLR